MSDPRGSFGLWLVCALGGALAAYLWAVGRAEPATYDASLSAWQWFWNSYGAFLGRGLLFGAGVGAVLIWLAPRATAARRRG